MNRENVGQGHIYLVDDDNDILTYVGALLRLLGYEVRTFSDGSALLDMGNLEHPAVIILDMAMPGSNGLEIQKRLIERVTPATIIFLSGNSERQEIIEAMKAGAVDFLWKPVSRDALANAVASAMERATLTTLRFEQLRRVRGGLDQLSSREREVYDLMINGLQNRQIATRLGIRADTVKKHRAVICGKFLVDDTATLIELANHVSAHAEKNLHMRQP